MKSRLIKQLSLGLIALATFYSCDKKNEEIPNNSKEFQIYFIAESISITTIDSAKVVFSQLGRNNIVKTLTKNSGLLKADLSDLPDGTWAADVNIYITKADNRTVGVYRYSVPIVAPLNADFKMEAPSIYTDNWQEETLPSDMIEIAFTTSSIALEKVDSVKIIFSKASTSQELKAIKQGDKYNVDIHALPSGNWSAECITYARTTDFTRRMYIDTIQVTLPLHPSISLPAPTGKLNDSWESYIVMSAMTDVTVITAEDNTNPFFEIQVKDPTKWEYFHKEREAYNRIGGTNALVESASWDCQDQCYNIDGNKVRNTTAFANFSKNLGGKTWNNTEILLLVVGKNPADDLTFFYKF